MINVSPSDLIISRGDDDHITRHPDQDYDAKNNLLGFHQIKLSVLVLGLRRIDKAQIELSAEAE